MSQPEAYIAGLEGKREPASCSTSWWSLRARADRRHRPVGALRARPPGDGRLLVRARPLGLGREPRVQGADHRARVRAARDRPVTAWANTRNGRSQVALERVGFQREGVLRGWHRHGDHVHDVVVFGMLRGQWEHRACRGAGAGTGIAAGRVRGRVTRARCVSATQARTASAVATVAVVTCSPSSSAAQTRVSTGWASWTGRCARCRPAPARGTRRRSPGT